VSGDIGGEEECTVSEKSPFVRGWTFHLLLLVAEEEFMEMFYFLLDIVKRLIRYVYCVLYKRDGECMLLLRVRNIIDIIVIYLLTI
jgi:hypothetical protein